MLGRWAVSGLVALAVAGCAKPEPKAPPVALQPSQVESLVYWSADLNGQRVSMEGWVHFNNGEDGRAIAIGPELRSQPRGDGERLIFLDVENGEGPNQLHLPVVHTETIKGMPGAPQILTIDAAKATYQDTAGVAHPLGGKMRVTGKLRYVRAGKAGLWSDADTRSPTGRRFKPKLVDVVLEAPDA